MLVAKSWNYLAVGAALGAAVWACGPHFGISILGVRKETVLAAPSFSFYKQLMTLVPKPTDGLVVEPQIELAGEELTGLDPAGATRLRDVRLAKDGREAYRRGEGLPEAVRRYAAGAVSFTSGQFDQAKEHFEAILRLPEAERRAREVWAHFMLGRVARQQGLSAEAIARFGQARAAARRKLPDPLGLGVASLGEEARVNWESGDIASAVRLYAQQAAYGSESGRASLLVVARQIVAGDKLLDRAVQDPLTRKLLLICLNARKDGDWSLDRVVAAMERHGISETPGAGLLAAASYGRGNFALAERLAAKEQGGAAAWVRAKLALRRGDREGALREYSRALDGARRQNDDGMAAEVVASELGVARLGGGEFVPALALLLEAASNGWDGPYGGYWVDAAHLAERVLKVEELRQYVDRSVPAVRFVPKDEYDPAPPSRQLRALLARRLMREGRHTEALNYFDDSAVRASAVAYRDALARAQSFWRPRVWRAEAWMEAARLARHHGIDLLGYELAPDYAAWGGNYEWPPEEKPSGDFVTVTEVERVKASAAPRNVRLQYRLTAVDHAMKAADLVPARSAGFAAALCEAAGWVSTRHPETAKAVYRRYLKEGAWVPWAKSFPGECPAVRLESAAGWQARIALRRLSRRAGFDVIPLFGLLLSSALVAVFMKWRYRPSAR